ncbi:MAG: NAD(P)-binding domain-containing protein [Bdellovibrionales bacterium]
MQEQPFAGMVLDRLRTSAKTELSLLCYPAREWVIPRLYQNNPVTDVVIVGGGQGGMAVALGLRKAQVPNIRIFDQAAKGQEGPWNRFARMETLRTPKHLMGPAMGIPSLTPQAWYKAKYGDDAWDTLGKIPVQDWHSYLQYFREAAEIPVENNMRVTAIDIAGPEDDAPLKITIDTPDGLSTIFARKAVLATGIEQPGTWYTPEIITGNLPKDRYHHTSEDIDFSALTGKRIAVIGGSASAFDNAATALENGAASVAIFIRRQDIPRDNPFRWMEKTGFLQHMNALPNEQKWEFTEHIWRINQPPPQETFDRCAKAHSNFSLHEGSPLQNVETDGEEIVLTTPKGTFRFDHLIAGTGFKVDFSAAPALSAFADNIATWGDRYTPPSELKNPVLSSYPYLGSGFEFQPKDPRQTPWMRHVLCFNYCAFPSMGLSGASISSMPFGPQAIVDGITKSFFRDDTNAYLHDLRTASLTELTDTKGADGLSLTRS